MHWLLGFFLIGTHQPVSVIAVPVVYPTEWECGWDGNLIAEQYNEKHWNGLVYVRCEQRGD